MTLNLKKKRKRKRKRALWHALVLDSVIHVVR